ncbi:chemotaxis protein : Methyl-accepting chemotaxis sensory transducer OS=Thiorhodospira sibirica ATCC 700588 GN=ThisiDRAFT_1409 PE=4 SV=1: 4HB_MCP_1: HAMP: MCPsignal [Gemmata massiliana]|uniref:Methyl-accepting transducer domain-containing protein n=1 Tax=Gemmata massiliana TaxID=1210884 RepID=A0A6P2DDK0_9BACT|nr:methyl-accepting chemotaxis protein [Gemmata massiliana]VTR97640.1 chemotaxis protein : Methyl-accepting chemotaxis sensory transducer OS=Thiorhodospira sibirica ATCC 700588 GN=ThisiDRAFT_1409 PE=4 SV=1: 4HB_MCP_1: HAMP: MCPsignal [Gemmata massiliana]
MSWFRNLKMAAKLGISFAVLVLLVACTGGLGLHGLGQVNDRAADIAKHADGLNHVQEANGELLRISRAVRNAILDADAASIDKRAADIRQADKRFRTEFEEYRQTIVKSDTKTKAAEVERQFNELRPLQDEIVALARAQKDEEAKARLPRIRAIADSMEEKINALVESKQELIKQAQTDASTTYAQLRGVVTAVVVGACVLAIALGVTLSRLTAGPLQKTMHVLEAVAKGDLTHRAEAKSTDEIGQMSAALNVAIGALVAAKEAERVQVEKDRERAAREAAEARERTEREAAATRAQAELERAQANELKNRIDTIITTVSSLAAGDFTQQIPDLGSDSVGQMANSLNKAVVSVRTALEGVREVSEQLADASGQLSAASDEISTGAQEQASSLEETASTLEEITATVRQNSDSAQQARQLASSSKDIAEKGGQVVGNAVEAMSEINQSSKKIADIITTIDEIAFQTNLLALNAAVEAARAGEQGRGFAVVASEVRNLAQRSATAAKEIKSLIEDSVKKVDAGTELVNLSGSTLGDIVTSVKRVTDLITEIAAAGKEQSVGIEQVNKAVSQMDSVTQRNASQTEEMSATAQTLTDQAAQLRDLVARFKLSEERRSAPRPASKGVRSKAPTTKPRPAVTRALNASRERDPFDGAGNDGFTEF